MEITVTKGEKKWVHSMSLETYDDKWEAYDDARSRYPNAVIKVEGVGVFNGGSPITTQNAERKISRVSGEATPAS